MNEIKNIPDKEMLEAIDLMAEGVSDAKAYGIAMYSRPEAMGMVMKIGYSLGIHPLLAPNFIYEFNDKYALMTKTMLALVQRSGSLHSMKIGDVTDANGAVVGRFMEAVRRNPGGEFLEYRAQFTLTDAKRAKLISNDNWIKYPFRMCEWRAISWVCNSLFGDIIGGMQSTEEIGMNHDASGNPILVTEIPVESSFVEIDEGPSLATRYQELIKNNSDRMDEIVGYGIPTSQSEFDAIVEGLGEKDAS